MKIKRFLESLLFVGVVALCCSCDSDDPQVPISPDDSSADSNTPTTDETDVPDNTDTDDRPDIVWTEPADMPEANWPTEFEPLPEYIRPMATVGKRWYTRFPTSEQNGFYYDHWCSIDEQVELNGEQALHIQGMAFSTDLDFYLKEDNGIVYVTSWNIWTGDPKFAWTYVMDINVSQPTYSSYNFTMTPISRGTIKLMGKTRRAVKLYVGHNPAPGVPYEYWIEGIGPIKGYAMHHPVEFGWEMNPKIRTGGDLLLCYDNDELIYDYREFSPDLYEPVEVFTTDYDGLPEY